MRYFLFILLAEIFSIGNVHRLLQRDNKLIGVLTTMGMRLNLLMFSIVGFQMVTSNFSSLWKDKISIFFRFRGRFVSYSDL